MAIDTIPDAVWPSSDPKYIFRWLQNAKADHSFPIFT